MNKVAENKTVTVNIDVKVNVLVVPNVAGWLELYIGLVEFGSVIVTVTVSDWPSFPFNVTVHLESFLSSFVLVSQQHLEQQVHWLLQNKKVEM